MQLQRCADGLLRYLRSLHDRYVMGVAQQGIWTERELRSHIRWVCETTVVDPTAHALVKEQNQRRVDLIKGELDQTGAIMSDQFSKIGVLVALLGFIIGFSMIDRSSGARSLAIKVVCLAAMYAVWAQMPRFKVFKRFKKRQDVGLRIGKVETLWDAYWYYYQWVVRRENTTNNIERLVVVATLATIVALAFVLGAA